MFSDDAVNLMSPEEQASNGDASPRPGDLDGITIMRYAPFYRQRSSGGVEQSLRRLNQGLLQRHRLKILQVHRVADLRTERIEVEQIGKGQVVWVPVAYKRTARRFVDLPTRAQFVYEQTIQSCTQNGDAMQHAIWIAVKRVLRHRMLHLRHRIMVISDPLCQLLMTHNVDLLAAHGLTYDADPLIVDAKKAGIPFVLINHFHNALLSEPQVRNWFPFARGVGSVSGKFLPDYVRDVCVNLSDAVDTEYFAPENAPADRLSERPIILLPAIIKMGKGQQDLLQAARILAGRNLDFEVFFAGTVESESLRQELHQYANTIGLKDRVRFLGELKQEALRNYYALSSIVVLPTSTEGLPRVLLEAQAMQRPVVAYDSGGVGATFSLNETGFLVKTGDVEGLADRIGYLLVNEDERRRMGERGREFVLDKFSVSSLIQRHEVFYLKALSGRNTLDPAKNLEIASGMAGSQFSNIVGRKTEPKRPR
jgi:glycosyltransferase involved in cell wall biosynthesis